MSAFRVPRPINEPVQSYAPGSPERVRLIQALADLKNEPFDIPMYIGGEEVRTKKKHKITSPHNHDLTLGYYYEGGEKELKDAISSATKAQREWSEIPWAERAAIFLRAAELLAGPYRATMNAAAMLGHSKNIYQAEIDAACELIDFWRYNVWFTEQIYSNQPDNAPGIWNRTDHRPLEGFILSITPFNFISINGNLPTAPAMLGNVSVWKPATTAIYTSHVIMKLLREAGLPDGVANLVFTPGSLTGRVAFAHRDFAGVHFTGSTGVFQGMWRTIGENIANYRSYPRIVGETGGKDFVIAHTSADVRALAVALVRGAYEYQGQKCSAASRAYIPKSLWGPLQKEMRSMIGELKMGDPEDFTNFVNAVIDEGSFTSITNYIEFARKASDAEIVAGGDYSKKDGYFIAPTLVKTSNPKFKLLEEEIFGPVLTTYVYPDKDFDKALELVDTTSPYALTGAIFSNDRRAVELAHRALRQAAGNFYINDKPTGAVVGQQPFGGARASGTNDKAGGIQNMLRWTSPRSIKENLNPPKDYRYPFMG